MAPFRVVRTAFNNGNKLWPLSSKEKKKVKELAVQVLHIKDMIVQLLDYKALKTI